MPDDLAFYYGNPFDLDTLTPEERRTYATFMERRALAATPATAHAAPARAFSREASTDLATMFADMGVVHPAPHTYRRLK